MVKQPKPVEAWHVALGRGRASFTTSPVRANEYSHEGFTVTHLIPARELKALRRVMRAAKKEHRVHQDCAFEPCAKGRCSLCRAVEAALRGAK